MSKTYVFGAALGALALLIGACSYLGYISFQKPLTPHEFALQQRIENFYYEDMDSAFFSGNAEALAGLYSPDISVPMNWNQVHAWAVGFFKAHPKAHFKVTNLAIDQMSYVRAVTRVQYSVMTADGTGDFSGYERDILVQSKGSWYIAAWEKLNPKDEPKASLLNNRGSLLSSPFDAGESPASRSH